MLSGKSDPIDGIGPISMINNTLSLIPSGDVRSPV